MKNRHGNKRIGFIMGLLLILSQITFGPVVPVRAEDPSLMEKLGFVGPLTGVSQPQYEVRQRDSFDFNWKFQLGDAANLQNPALDDSGWRTLDLPHDWSIEGVYSKDNPTGHDGGYLPAGIGWYRKTFTWSSAWAGKKVFIDFDGIYMNSKVWINGRQIGYWPYGYTNFRYDLTPYLNTGNNVIAVRADNSLAPSARWYTGCGIYRHTWLVATDNLHVRHWGTYVTTSEITSSSAKINIKTKIVNENTASKNFTLLSKIINAAGSEVGSLETAHTLGAGLESEIAQTITISNPHLWSINDPYLYNVKTYLKINGAVVDDYITEIGVRYFSFSTTGFKLNGVPMIIKGMCLHHEAGPVGAAVPEQVLERRLKLLKQMGTNAIRTSHNPMAPEFYHLCNRLGLLVMDEAFDGWETVKAPYDYGLYFDATTDPGGNGWWDDDLRNMVLRNRNHPSVFMWSIGNEVPGKTTATQNKLMNLVRTLDPTRPITAGYNDGGNNPFRAALDVGGYNEWDDNTAKVESDHVRYPNQPFIGTEWPHTYQTRGKYMTISRYYAGNVIQTPNLTAKEIFDTYGKYESSYDNCHTGMSNRISWKFVKAHPYFTGIFRWTGVDYLGETNHHPYPYRHGDKGLIDLVGFPKDLYYFYKSQWTNEPVIHILPHWTHPGMEGVSIPVWVYTNCSSVELFFNGVSLGVKQMTAEMYLSWNVPYAAGELKAVGKKTAGDGSIQTYIDTVATASDPARINLYADNTALIPNNRDISHLAFEVADGNGRFVPNANDMIKFKVIGPAKNLGMDNGDSIDLSPYKVNLRKVFSGLGLGIFQATQETGNIEVFAFGILSSTRNTVNPKIAIDVQRIMLRGSLPARNLKIYYTTDGSEPGLSSPLYTAPFAISNGTLVKAAVYDGTVKIMTLRDDEKPLLQLITEAQNLNRHDYTVSAWAALQTTLQQAIVVNDNRQATQEMIDQANTTLQAAVNNKMWVQIEDSEVTQTSGAPLHKFYYYATNKSWVQNADDGNTFDNPQRTNADYALIKFSGTKIQLYATRSWNEGYVYVSIDGGTEVKIDLYYNVDPAQKLKGALVYTSPDLAYGQHTLKVRCADQSSGNPNNRSINVDFVKIRQAAYDNLFSDPGFEEQAASAVLAPWEKVGNGAGIDRGKGFARSGQNNGFIRYNSGWNSVRQLVTVTPNTNYRLIGYVKTSANNTQGDFGVNTASGILIKRVLFGRCDNYTQFTIDFNSGANSSVRVYAGMAASSDTWIQLDDFSLIKTDAETVIIKDNDAGAPGYTETGAWTTSSGAGYNGGNYRYSSTSGSSTATWNFNLPTTGNWKISAIYKAGTNRATSGKFNVVTASGTQAGYVNQTLNDLTWVTLGTWSFNAGGGIITLDAAGSSPTGTVVIADAMKAEKL